MPTQVRCPCHGQSECKLCQGKRFYPYQPGPRGWIPFRCPTCLGKGLLGSEPANQETCFTCNHDGIVDPANPPFDPGWGGIVRSTWKTFFGGG